MTRPTPPLLSALRDHLSRARKWLVLHACKWVDRFKQLDTKSEALEVALAIFTGWMALFFARCPDAGTGSHMADQMFSLAPRVLWVWGLTGVSTLGILGFLEDSIPARRTSAFLSFAFWFGTGAWLAPRYPNFYTPGLHMLVGFFASWVWTRIGELCIKKRYRERRPRVCAGARPNGLEGDAGGRG